VSSQDQRRIALTGLRTRLADRLPAVLEETVRGLVAGWKSDSATQEVGVAHPVPFLVVRTQPDVGARRTLLSGCGSTGLRLRTLWPAPRRAFISRRGSCKCSRCSWMAQSSRRSGKAAHHLFNDSRSHQEHVDKTESRNRTELIARVLGWERTLRPEESGFSLCPLPCDAVQ